MVDIIIVNWNAGEYIEDCIASVLAQSASVLGQIIVVDNCSTDGSYERLRNNPSIKVVRLAENMGFAKGCNAGSIYATSPYLLFLNPDTLLEEDAIGKSLLFMEDSENRKVAVCGVKQVDESGQVLRHCNRSPSLSTFFFYSLNLTRVLPRLGHVMEYWDHEESRRVDHVIGSYYFIRREVFFDCRGFDEDFYVYLEDLDLSMRLKSKGWSSNYLADATVRHFCGGSSRKIKAKRLFYSLRSRLIYIRKHFGRTSFFSFATLCFLIELPLRLLNSIIDGSRGTGLETLHGYKWLASWLLMR